jgi:hypothetical protein
MGSYAEVMRMPEDVKVFGQSVSHPDSPDYPLPLSHLTVQNVAKPAVPAEVSARPALKVSRKAFRETPFRRTLSFPIENLPGALPLTQVDPDVDHAAIAESCILKLNNFTPDIFTADAIWRDIYALTGIVRTFSGVGSISDAWTDLLPLHRPAAFKYMPGSSKIARLGKDHSWIAARFTFCTSGTPATRCSGQIGMVPTSDGQWKVWMITSILEELDGFANPDYMTAAGVSSVRQTPENGADYECIVVGAGFAGLCLAGRLKAMGVNYLVIEKNRNVGDNWTNRYDSARFHTTKYYSDMPFTPIFREGYDYFPSGEELARGYQNYVDMHQIKISLSTTLDSATFDEVTELWTLHMITAGKQSTLRTPHFVFAIGAGGSIPKMPELPGKENYRGTVMHSVSYKNARDWRGKIGIVVGTANTAHDVAEDMLAAGMKTTMIQRGRTSVFPIKHYQKWSDPLYNPTVPIEEADRQIMAMPIAITRQASLLGTRMAAGADPEYFDSLERAGFRVERYGDLWKLLSDRLGGHYMDVGCSKKIADGLVCEPPLSFRPCFDTYAY